VSGIKRDFQCVTARCVERALAAEPERAKAEPAALPAVEYFTAGEGFSVGDIAVTPFTIPHDAADPVGFVFESEGVRVGIATDLGYMPPNAAMRLRGCDVLMLESNHDLDMLRMGTYPWSLKRRIMSRFGHLSNDDSVSAVQRMIGADLKTLCMIHLSQKNNHESIVRDMTARMITRTGAQLELGIAKQFEATGIFEVARRRPARPLAPARNVQMALF